MLVPFHGRSQRAQYIPSNITYEIYPSLLCSLQWALGVLKRYTEIRSSNNLIRQKDDQAIGAKCEGHRFSPLQVASAVEIGTECLVSDTSAGAGAKSGPTNKVNSKMRNVDQPYGSLGNLKAWAG